MKTRSLFQLTALLLGGYLSGSFVHADTIVYAENKGGGLEFDQSRGSDNNNDYTVSMASTSKSSSSFLEIEPVTTALHAQGQLVEKAYAASMGFSQHIGDQSVHMAAYTSPETYSLNAGLGFGKTTLSVGVGHGSENAWLSKEDFALNNEFKYGFSPADYDYQGMNLHYQANKHLSLNASGINVDVDGRVGSDVYTAGIGLNNFSADMLNVQRNGKSIGRGFSLAYYKDDFSGEFSSYRDYNNFDINSLQFSLDKGKRGSYALELSSGHSPFNGVSDTQAMLTYKKQWGSQYSLAVAEDRKARRGGGAGKAVLIGLGVAAGIAAASSSSSGNGDGGSGGYYTQHDAARDVLNRINPTSVRENTEYGGWISRAVDGTYSSTPPVKGDIDSVNIGYPPNSATASYHTHGGPDPRYDNENFSSQDINLNYYYSLDGYLGTPAGKLKYHSVSTGEVVTLGDIAK
jgi:hypothetical protein